MANYPAPPGHRMAYDRDGSVVAYWSGTGGAITQLSGPQMQTLNNESNDALYNIGHPITMVTIFPQLRDLVGYVIAWTWSAGGYLISAGPLEVSSDTTTGQDGTWSSLVANHVRDTAVTPQYRNGIHAISAGGVKAVRWTGDSSGGTTVLGQMYWGDITAGSEGDSLQLWNPATDVRLSGSALDFGDVPRSNVAQKQFRIKNRSATKTANNVVVGLEALTDATPSLGSQHQFSLDGSTWASTVTVTSIAPGAISPLVYVRRSTNAAAALSVWAARITCVPGSWT